MGCRRWQTQRGTKAAWACVKVNLRPTIMGFKTMGYGTGGRTGPKGKTKHGRRKYLQGPLKEVTVPVEATTEKGERRYRQATKNRTNQKCHQNLYPRGKTLPETRRVFQEKDKRGPQIYSVVAFQRQIAVTTGMFNGAKP